MFDLRKILLILFLLKLACQIKNDMLYSTVLFYFFPSFHDQIIWVSLSEYVGLLKLIF